MTPAPPALRAPRVRIGVAGWSIPSRHAALFGDADSHLARYATRFDVAEVNSTFHRPHQPRTFERWAAAVPRGFRFSVKLPRAITHEARLQGVGGALDAFLDSIAGLGPKLGGLLVQLPPGLAFDARVAADPARVPEAAHPGGAGAAARWRYWRWHGAPRIYYSRYGDDALAALAQALLRAGTARAPAWCILDNTAHGHAMDDAARLQAAVWRPVWGVSIRSSSA